MVDYQKKMGSTWVAETMDKDGRCLWAMQFFLHCAFTSVNGTPKIKWMRMATVPTNCMIDNPSGKMYEHAFAINQCGEQLIGLSWGASCVVHDSAGANCHRLPAGGAPIELWTALPGISNAEV